MMPWKIIKQDNEWCVYKHDDNGDAIGDSLGCHDTEDKAKKHLAALYANEPRANMPRGTIAPAREQRILAVPDLQVRAEGDGKPPVIEGYAAVFNQPSVVMSDWAMGGFREFVAPGAFKKTLSDGADVRALVNHNPDYVLGRTKSGTLSLREDGHGLHMEIHPPATRWAEDLITTMQRGDIDGSSFGFQAIRDRWGQGQTPEGETIDERYVLEARLFDVSVVTYPAYPQTESQVRSAFAAAGLDMDALAQVILRSQRQLSLRAQDRAMARTAIDYLTHCIATTAPTPTSHPADDVTSAPAQSGHPLAYYRKMLTEAEQKFGK
jgi:uncharacterized protein